MILDRCVPQLCTDSESCVSQVLLHASFVIHMDQEELGPIDLKNSNDESSCVD